MFQHTKYPKIIFFLTILFAFSQILNSDDKLNKQLLDAVIANNLNQVKQLVEKGADVNIRDVNNTTLVMMAAYKGNIEIVKYLISKKVDPKAKGIITRSGLDGKPYGSPICCAAGQGHLEVVRYLIEECGVDVNDPERTMDKSKTGWTPIIWAVDKGHRKIIDYLVYHGANINYKSKIDLGTSALHIAVISNQKEMVSFLLDNGAEVDIKNDLKLTPYHLSLHKGYRDIADILKKNGAETAITTKEASFALKNSAKELIRKGDELARISKNYEAIIHFENALQILSSLSGGLDTEVPVLYGKMGVLNNILGNFSMSLKHFKKTLRINLKLYGENHGNVALAYWDLGTIYSRIELFEDALKNYEKALGIQRKIFAKDNLQITHTMISLGLLKEKMNKYDEALAMFEEALKIRQRLLGREHSLVAEAYAQIGGFYHKKWQHEKSLHYYLKAIQVLKSINQEDSRFASIILKWIASGYRSINKYQKALDSLQKSLKIEKDLSKEASPNFQGLLGVIGDIYCDLNKFDLAMDYYKKSLKIALNIFGNNHYSVAHVFAKISRLYLQKGDFHKALKYRKKSLQISLNFFKKNQTAITLEYISLGAIFLDLGNYSRAVETYRKALDMEISKTIKDYSLVALCYDSLGITYRKSGQYKKALINHMSALKIHKHKSISKNRKQSNIATSYSHLGHVYFGLSNYNKALEYFKRSLNTRLKIYGPIHLHIGYSYNFLGNTYSRIGQYSEALKCYQNALNISHKILGPNHKNTALTQANIGHVYFNSKKYNQAILKYQRGIELAKKMNCRKIEAKTRFYLSLAFKQKKRLNEATDQIKKSLAINDRIRHQLEDHDDKISFYITYVNRYRYFIKLLLDQKEYKKSFSISEKSKSVVFSEMMAKKGARDRIAWKSKGFQALLTKETSLLQRIHRTEQVMKNKKDEELTTLAGQLGNLYKELETIQNRMKTDFPQYAELLYPKEVSLEEVQQLLTDYETYLSYYMLDDYTVVFIVTKGDFKHLKLNIGRRKIETGIAELRQQIISRKNSNYIESSHNFYKELFKPVERYIKTKKLIVSADGSLYGFPLEALVTNIPKDLTDQSGNTISKNDLKRLQSEKKLPLFYEYSQVTFLADKYTLSYIPSAASLKILRTSKGQAGKAAKGVFAVADPIFSKDDPRITQKKIEEYSIKGDLLVQSKAVKAWPPGRLPQTAEEAKTFTKTLGGGDVLLGGEASEKNVFTRNLSGYKYILFSTHGLLGNEISARERVEPSLLLSLVGNPEEFDGYLEMSEATGLDLNCDLIILSTCNSTGHHGRGGEGFAGMVRSLLFAGSNGVIASHWKVENIATKELMILLATELKNNNGMVALQRARRKFRSQILEYDTKKVCMAHPFFWASFVYLGQ